MRRILPVGAVLLGLMIAIIADRTSENSPERRNDIVVVAALGSAGRAAVRPPDTAVDLAGAVADTRWDGAALDGVSLPDPAVEAALERGTQADMRASEQRMLERQKSMPDYASSPAIDAPGMP